MQGRLVASCLSPGGAPSLAFPSLAAPDRDAVDGATLFFSVNSAVRSQAELDRRKKAKQEKHEKLVSGVADRLRHRLPVTEAEREAWPVASTEERFVDEEEVEEAPEDFLWFLFRLWTSL